MFQLPQTVKSDIEKYKRSLGEFLSGRLSPARFKGMRVPWGIYSHRGGKSYMMRIRIPSGVVTARQLEALANASEKFSDRSLHLTTRQDIQIHGVAIENTPKALDYLKEYDLSPRGGGGNTVRNVTGCALAGICDREVFDIRPHAVGLSEYLLSSETSFNLPRKFKVTFSGCRKDCGGALVNDVGFVAVRSNGNSGFRVFAGGGLGAKSRVGSLLEDFIPESEVGCCVAAIKAFFLRHGDRRNKHHNRLRFLVEDMGFQKFKESYQQELGQLKSEEHIVLRTPVFPDHGAIESQEPCDRNDGLGEFMDYSVKPQKQRGYVSVELKIPNGDVSCRQMLALAALEKDFPGIEYRCSPNQNLHICWLRSTDLYKLFTKLKEALDNFLYPRTLVDPVCCKGASTCNLGLCNSPALGLAIERELKKDLVGKQVFKKYQIRLNGCPNACGQHPVSEIGLFGVVKRVDNRLVPFYKLLLGGRKEAEKTRLAREVGLIPAKAVPAFLRDFLGKLENLLENGATEAELLDSAGMDLAGEMIDDLAGVPSFEEEPSYYTDWGKDKPFTLDGLSQGECGAGVLDMIASDLAEARLALEEARRTDYSETPVKRALLLAARSLLVVRGSDPNGEDETFLKFKQKFLDTGIVDDRFGNVESIYRSEIGVEEKYSFAHAFLEHMERLYDGMDSSFDFHSSPSAEKQQARPTEKLDLKGTPCPINYVKAKLAIEALQSGDILEVLLDEGEPIVNVTRSLKIDGNRILGSTRMNGYYSLVVEVK